MFVKRIKNYDFVAPSKKKLKKYDVYSSKTGEYITSFGAIHPDSQPYEQYFDKISYYKDYDHGDKERRRLYRLRHNKDNIKDKTSPAYFSWFYLW
jgi:hypothetical protein